MILLLNVSVSSKKKIFTKYALGFCLVKRTYLPFIVYALKTIYVFGQKSVLKQSKNNIYIYKTLSTRQHRIIKLRICFFPKMVFLFLTGRQKLYHLNNLYVIRLFYRFEF